MTWQVQQMKMALAEQQRQLARVMKVAEQERHVRTADASITPPWKKPGSRGNGKGPKGGGGNAKINDPSLGVDHQRLARY